MSKLLSVLIAAVFAAVSFTAVAADAAMDQTKLAKKHMKPKKHEKHITKPVADQRAAKKPVSDQRAADKADADKADKAAAAAK